MKQGVLFFLLSIVITFSIHASSVDTGNVSHGVSYLDRAFQNATVPPHTQQVILDELEKQAEVSHRSVHETVNIALSKFSDIQLTECLKAACRVYVGALRSRVTVKSSTH